jgi:hypothetical protein
MIDRLGQVWLARKRNSWDAFVPCVIIKRDELGGHIAWILRPLDERLCVDDEEFGQYESQFFHVELGGMDPWIKEHIV